MARSRGIRRGVGGGVSAWPAVGPVRDAILTAELPFSNASDPVTNAREPVRQTGGPMMSETHAVVCLMRRGWQFAVISLRLLMQSVLEDRKHPPRYVNILGAECILDIML